VLSHIQQVAVCCINVAVTDFRMLRALSHTQQVVSVLQTQTSTS